MTTLSLELIARLRVDLSETWDVGEVPGGFRRIIPIVGGEMDGPLLRGTVIGVGADWNLSTGTHSGALSARYALRTHDGVVISVQNDARFHGTEAWPMLTSPSLEAPAGDYEWLNSAVLVGTLRPGAEGSSSVHLEFFRTVVVD